MFGFAASSSRANGEATVATSVRCSISRATAASITPGSISGSSPWMFTTMSLAPRASRSAASASRLVPLGCSALVITHSPPNDRTASSIRGWSVATTIRESVALRRADSTTCWIRGLPVVLARTFSGNRDEARRAGMRPTMAGGWGVLATLRSVAESG